MLKKIDALLNDKLQNIEWGEYKIGDLFDVDSWIYGKNKNWITRNENKSYNSLPVISGVTINNGVSYYTNDEADAEDVFQDSLTISTRGEYSGTVTFHDGKFLLANNILVMKMDNLTKRQKIFIGSLINNLGYGGYSGYPRKETLKNDMIKLPVNKGKIDFKFMESFIAELEAQRVAELESYLNVTGLKDYKLKNVEINAIDNLKKVKWQEFKIGDLFGRVITKKLPYKAKELPKEPTGNYNLPLLTSSFINQGLNYFAPKTGATILKNVISIPSNSDVYRSYYQSREFSVLSDAYAIEWKYENIKLSPDVYLFLVSCINKVTDLSIYSYKNKLGGWNVVKNKYIKLPVDKNGGIDFIFMENITQAIKKLVIKDVSIYSDKKLEVTKDLSKYKK
ncbi:restriction endonuclease subunit S [Finegoldia magna]|uniref:restriction endonuclease subunit S n=1 Tax=Finegoldia magna TaxID=1260 RepID=UPI00350E35B3